MLTPCQVLLGAGNSNMGKVLSLSLRRSRSRVWTRTGEIRIGGRAGVWPGRSLGIMAVGGPLREGVRSFYCFTVCSFPHPLYFFPTPPTPVFISTLDLSSSSYTRTGRLNSNRFPNKFTASAFISKCTMPTVSLEN